MRAALFILYHFILHQSDRELVDEAPASNADADAEGVGVAVDDSVAETVDVVVVDEAVGSIESAFFFFLFFFVLDAAAPEHLRAELMKRE